MKVNEGFIKAKKSRSSEGSTLTEYAIILGLISLISWGAISALGIEIANLFNMLGSEAVGITREQNKNVLNLQL
ncbi:MAG: hypothetical protein WCG04_02490 [Alphaproteobacteria bacterium]